VLEQSSPEQGVDVREESIAGPDGITDAGRVWLPCQPGLTPLGLQVGVATEKGVESAQLQTVKPATQARPVESSLHN
jgi:hypothetical protein